MLYSEKISSEEIESLELVSFDGPISVISEIDEEYNEAITYLERQQILGFDTETKPCFQSGMPQNHVALLQLSGEDKAFLFRVNKLGIPQSLAKILGDPQITKVGAAVNDDIKGLQFYTKFQAKGFVDLQKLAAEFGIKDKSVKKLAANILGLRVSKAQQLSNWEAANLSGAQLKYAAIDAWICRKMYITLKSTK